MVRYQFSVKATPGAHHRPVLYLGSDYVNEVSVMPCDVIPVVFGSSLGGETSNICYFHPENWGR